MHRIDVDGDGFAEGAGAEGGAVELNGDRSLFAGEYRFFCIVCRRAAAAGGDMMNDERRLSRVGHREGMLLYLVLLEGPEVMRLLVEVADWEMLHHRGGVRREAEGGRKQGQE